MNTPGIPPGGSPSTVDGAVEVRTAAAAKHLSSVRAVVADLAMREDFDLDTVADLRLAVDEACSSLVQLATEHSTLSATFWVGADALRMIATVHSGSAEVPSSGTFSWQVLDTLADSVRSEVRPDGDNYLVCIELVKQKAGR